MAASPQSNPTAASGPFHIRAYSADDAAVLQNDGRAVTDTADDFAEARLKALSMARGSGMVAYVRDAEGKLAAWVERGQFVVRHGYKP